jgi:hypothetical protein
MAQSNASVSTVETKSWDDELDTEGCRKLANAVILRAVQDAMGKIEPGEKPDIVRDNERLHATLFLTAEEGRWANAREFWTSLAGLDADVVMQKARGMLV